MNRNLIILLITSYASSSIPEKIKLKEGIDAEEFEELKKVLKEEYGITAAKDAEASRTDTQKLLEKATIEKKQVMILQNRPFFSPPSDIFKTPEPCRYIPKTIGKPNSKPKGKRR
ncbi:MAG: hypothetical protein IJ545_05410 [Alphaproteobacteria bacterium]|nr:hypothetical protein [Alphaproteobacteria bacterium]